MRTTHSGATILQRQNSQKTLTIGTKTDLKTNTVLSRWPWKRRPTRMREPKYVLLDRKHSSETA